MANFKALKITVEPDGTPIEKTCFNSESRNTIASLLGIPSTTISSSFAKTGNYLNASINEGGKIVLIHVTGKTKKT